ncbi:MAG: pilus assembly protein TadG-related protein [Alsobacter sp.]
MKRPWAQNILCFVDSTSGGFMVLSAIVMMAVIGFAALAADVANVYVIKSKLQATTDAAAQAGALDINCNSCTAGQAKTTALAYSARATGANAITSAMVSVPSGYPKLKCVPKSVTSNMTLPDCPAPDNANTLIMQQQAVVPLKFAKLFGFPSITLTSTATALGPGGGAPSMNIYLILDISGSMGQNDPNCSIKNTTKLNCALAGIKTMLLQFLPTMHKLGVMMFPPITQTSQAQYSYDCEKTTQTNSTAAQYNQTNPGAPIYNILSPLGDYRTSDAATTLSNNSALVRLIGAATNCSTSRLRPVGGFGFRTYFADALAAAQAELTKSSKPGTKNVIVFLSDGDANAQSGTNIAPGKYANQCQQAIDIAKAAANNGTWIYSIAYYASTSKTQTCTTDGGKLSGCDTMRQIASDPTKFYSSSSGTGSSGCNSAANMSNDLVQVFQYVAKAMLYTALIPDKVAAPY